MRFTTDEFIVLAALFFAVWPWVRHQATARWLWIVACSAVFYGWGEPWFLLLLGATITVDYHCARAMVRWPAWKSGFLAVSLAWGLGNLCLFKYLDFFIDTVNRTADLAGWPLHLPPANLPLPLGISFFTFQSLAYVVDVYRGRHPAVHNGLHYAAYLSFFPQLVAGPIVRAEQFLGQLNTPGQPSDAARWEGVKLVVAGFFRKMVLADGFAPVVEDLFSLPDTRDSARLWLGASLFSLQIYCDFSGYSHIARGLAKFCGYDLPLNFDHPFAVGSLREFWTRWHMTLSSWLRDYLYHPLRGRHPTPWRRDAALWITMLASGLWHGAAWTFVVWGALYALFLTIERHTRWPERVARWPGGIGLAALIVFLQVALARVYFRTGSLEEAWTITWRMFAFIDTGVPLFAAMPLQVPLLAALVLAREAFFLTPAPRWALWRGPFGAWIEVVTVALMMVACVFLRGPGQTFVYFRF